MTNVDSAWMETVGEKANNETLAFYGYFKMGYEAAIAAERSRIIAELEDIQQGGDEWRRYDEALRKALEHYADKDNWCESQHEDNVELDITWYIGADNEGRKYGWTVAAEALEATGGEK